MTRKSCRFLQNIIKLFYNTRRHGGVFVWWGKVDSNHRRHCQQIYSLSPLATREFPHMQLPNL